MNECTEEKYHTGLDVVCSEKQAAFRKKTVKYRVPDGGRV